MTRLDVLREFYRPFAENLSFADEKIGHVELPVEVSDIPCEFCGQMMVIKQGRYGKFLACPGFPNCRNTKPIIKEVGVHCPLCGGAIVERKTKRGKIFYGCKNYPQCEFMTWDVPLQESCSECNSFMLKHAIKKGIFQNLCSNPLCPTRQNESQKDAKSVKNIEAKKSGTKKSVAKKSTPKKKSTKSITKKVVETVEKTAVKRGQKNA